jgi:hypothetical protein
MVDENLGPQRSIITAKQYEDKIKVIGGRFSFHFSFCSLTIYNKHLEIIRVENDLILPE